MEHPINPDELPAQVSKVCGPKAPPPLKAMAAGGVVPLGPVDVVTVLYVLSYDTDNTVAKKAKTSLAKMPANVLHGALSQVKHPTVLDGLAHLLADDRLAMQKIALNQSLDGETAAWLAATSRDEQILEMIAANETRLLKQPLIIEALYNNKSVRMSTADRAVELAVRAGLELKGISSFNEVKAAIQGELIPEACDEPTPDDVLFKENLESEEWKQLDQEQVDSAYEEIEKTGENAADEEQTGEAKQVQSLEQTLSKLTTSAKIRVATLGSSSQRAVLIRDSNKLVIMAVVKSPGLKESEVMLYSRYRSLPEEAVRYMANNREWTKNYSVKLNLVHNPRCPLEIALRFLPHLRNHDVRGLERDKNIPQAIAKAAKQLHAKRTK